MNGWWWVVLELGSFGLVGLAWWVIDVIRWNRYVDNWAASWQHRIEEINREPAKWSGDAS